MSFDSIDRRFRRPEPIRLECLCCGITDGVEMENSRTAYPYDGPIGGPDDPNRPIPLCRRCAAAHHTNMDHAWADYRAGVL